MKRNMAKKNNGARLGFEQTLREDAGTVLEVPICRLKMRIENRK